MAENGIGLMLLSGGQMLTVERKRMNCNKTIRTNRNSIFSGIPDLTMAVILKSIGIDLAVPLSQSGQGAQTSVPNIVVSSEFYDLIQGIGDVSVDRCLGSYMGMVLGDYLGAPIEFLDAKDSSNTIQFLSEGEKPASPTHVLPVHTPTNDTRPPAVVYPQETHNAFHIELGQWTDDASMGACMADSLIVLRRFSGSDIRSRFWNWWQAGYNNAFLYSAVRSPMRSVGLGGNISKSIAALDGLAYSDVPPTFQADNEDSGNGGLMRLTPVVLFYSRPDQLSLAMQYARESSQTTHPGAQASQAAEFMAFLIHRAINRPQDLHQAADIDISCSSADHHQEGQQEEQGLSPARRFLEEVVREYLSEVLLVSDRRAGSDQIRRLLESNEPADSTEYCWNWRTFPLPIEAAMRTRGSRYNGYLNNLGYFGSYCMDGLSVALNAFAHGRNVEEVLKICVDYRGDCDSTASIAGQIAGAFYGVTSIRSRLLDHTLRWDRGENILRALLLTPWVQNLGSSEGKGDESCVYRIVDVDCGPGDEDEDEAGPSDGVSNGPSSLPTTAASPGPPSLAQSFLHYLSCLNPFSAVKSTARSSSNAVDKRVTAFEAAMSGDSQALIALMHDLDSVMRGQLLLIRDDSERSLLHISAGNGHVGFVSTLLGLFAEHKVDSERGIDATDCNECTALILAITNAHSTVVNTLLAAGASLTLGHGVKNRNSVFLIAGQGFEDALDAALNAHGPSGMVPGRGAEIVLRLANASDAIGNTALHAAALSSQTAICRRLLRIGADLNIVSRDKSSALHIACRHARSIGVVRALLEHMTDVRSAKFADVFGSTPLHIACCNANVDAVRAILSQFPRVADLITVDNDGAHPLHIACQEFSRNVQLLAHPDSETDINEIEVKVETSELCIETLVRSGYPIQSVDYSDCTLFHSLCWGATTHHVKLMQRLLSEVLPSMVDNISPELLSSLIQQENADKWTCLHTCLNTSASCGEEMFQLLSRYVSPQFLSSFDRSKPREHSKKYLKSRGSHNLLSVCSRYKVLKGNMNLTGIAHRLLDPLLEGTDSPPPPPPPPRRPPRVVVLVGAGISTSCGIRDFRGSGGLYTDRTTAQVFSAECLAMEPNKFYGVMKTLFLPVVDGQFKPSPAHVLLRLLKDKGWLQRVFTQNIDMLELAVLPDESDILECHGSCKTARCTNSECKHRIQSREQMESEFWSVVRADGVPQCPLCQSTLRPDVVFFGEPLPPRFDQLASADLAECDLLLVMGTTLAVYPVASLPSMVPPHAARLLINREPTGPFQHVRDCSRDSIAPPPEPIYGVETVEEAGSTYRDVFYAGDCDAGAAALAEALGLRGEFTALVDKYCRV